MNKQSALNQIQEMDYNLHRLRTLVEVDLAFIGDSAVPIYCLEKIIRQAQNLQSEIISSKNITDGQNKIQGNTPVS